MNTYKLVWSDSSEKPFGYIGEDVLVKGLEEKVSLYMSQGWQCIGGVALSHSNGLVTRMYQTMVKST